MYYQRVRNYAARTTDHALRKHAYSNIQKISPKKTENFQIKKTHIFNISVQNIDEAVLTSTTIYVFLSRNKQKIMYIPVIPSFTV